MTASTAEAIRDCTAVGKVLLAYNPEAALALAAPLRAFTRNTIATAADLTIELADIR